MELKELTEKTFELFGVEQADQLGPALQSDWDKFLDGGDQK